MHPTIDCDLQVNSMEPERWQQIERLYHSALKIEPSQRAASPLTQMLLFHIEIM
jgi:hypothetical protein